MLIKFLRRSTILISSCLTLSFLLPLSIARAAPREVRYPEGLSQGFVSLSSLDGKTLGEGELSQLTTGPGRVESTYTMHRADSTEEPVVSTGHLDLPIDTYNGMCVTLLKNLVIAAVELMRRRYSS